MFAEWSGGLKGELATSDFAGYVLLAENVRRRCLDIPSRRSSPGRALRSDFFSGVKHLTRFGLLPELL
jgi:hypothetical protein